MKCAEVPGEVGTENAEVSAAQRGVLGNNAVFPSVYAG